MYPAYNCSINNISLSDIGNMKGARESAKTARNLNITGVIVGIIILTITMVLRFVDVF